MRTYNKPAITPISDKDLERLIQAVTDGKVTVYDANGNAIPITCKEDARDAVYGAILTGPRGNDSTAQDGAQ